MHFISRKPWDLPQSQHTPLEVYENRRWHRREFLRSLGMSVAGLGIGQSLIGCSKPTTEEITKAGAVEELPEEAASIYPAKRNAKFEYGRKETVKREAAEFCNFYEFTGPRSKAAWKYVGDFKPSPWKVEVDGLCSKPRTFDLDDIYKLFKFEERAYRHRCVETWAMCVPWTGFPLKDLLKLVEPKAAAKFVAFETFNRPDQARFMKRDSSFPWPYTEGLTIAEATNDLAFATTGVFGQQLPKQHGAPIRLVLPWKYGFKSIKSIVKITLTDKQPKTFWNAQAPDEYGFEANVNPDKPHPRWSQRTEWMLGTRERFDTKLYNGYGEYVASLYA